MREGPLSGGPSPSFHPLKEAAMEDQEVERCEDCGKPKWSFGCKVKHVMLNTGDAKAARD